MAISRDDSVQVSRPIGEMLLYEQVTTVADLRIPNRVPGSHFRFLWFLVSHHSIGRRIRIPQWLGFCPTVVFGIFSILIFQERKNNRSRSWIDRSIQDPAFPIIEWNTKIQLKKVKQQVIRTSCEFSKFKNFNNIWYHGFLYE